MELKNKVFKIASYSFIVFITALILFSFGMPDFLGKSANATRFLAAEVDGEPITRKEFGIAKENMQNDPRFKGGQIPARYLNAQALEQLIDRKVFYVMSKNAGFYPLSKVQTKILARYYKKNFQTFFNNGVLSFPKLERALKQNGTRLADVEKEAINGFALQQNYDLMMSITKGSELEALEVRRMEESKASLEIIAIDNDKRDFILRSTIKVSNREVRARFKKDFLSKDPKSKLTSTKIEALKNKIGTEKKDNAAKNFTINLQKMANSKSIKKIARAYHLKVISIKNFSPLDSLESLKKDKKQNDLTPLGNSAEFIKNVFKAPQNKIVGPFLASGTTYLFSIKKRTLSKLPSASEFIKANKSLREYFPEKEQFKVDELRRAVGKKHELQIFNAVFQILKNDYTIKRYVKST